MTTSAQAIGTGVVKSGWLQRQSDFLRRWKRDFCVLHNDGRFIYYTSESQKETEGMLQLRNCYAIKVGAQVQNAQPPSGYPLEGMFEVKTPENNVVFCADSSDDGQAWTTSMMEAKQAYNPAGATTTYTTAQYGGATTTQYGGAPPPYNPASGAAAPPYYAAAPPAYAPAPPPYAPVGQQTVTTTTTYRNNGQQQRVIIRQNNPAPVLPASNGGYPVQTAAYSYPGQTTYTTYGAPSAATVIPGQNPQQQQQQTIIYQQQQQQRNNNSDFIAGAAVGSMCMMPLLFW